MKKWILALIIAVIIFLGGKFVYDNYLPQLQAYFVKPNPNGVQASIASKGSGTQ